MIHVTQKIARESTSISRLFTLFSKIPCSTFDVHCARLIVSLQGPFKKAWELHPVIAKNELLSAGRITFLLFYHVKLWNWTWPYCTHCAYMSKPLSCSFCQIVPLPASAAAYIAWRLMDVLAHCYAKDRFVMLLVQWKGHTTFYSQRVMGRE